MSGKKSKKNWLESLPKGSANKIHDAIVAMVDKPITERTVYRILKGESKDNYGVLVIAAEIEKEEKKRLKRLSRIARLVA